MEANEKKLSKQEKNRVIFWVILTLFSALCLFGIMFAFYDQPLLLDDGTPNPNNLWGLETYGPVFTQMYGNTVWLGFGSFVIAANLIAAGTLISVKEGQKFNLTGSVVLLISTLAAATMAATIFIWVLSGIIAVMLIIYIIISSVSDMFYLEDEQQEVVSREEE